MKKIFLLILIILLLTSCGTKNNITPSPNPTSTPTHAPTPEPTPVPPPHEEENIGSFESKMLDMTQARVDNIKLAASKINGKVINSGEEFSFNNVVGVRSAENGYQEAPIIVEDRKENEVGGGICQLSTAIYNAALAAGLEITEHHTHTVKVPYIEAGKDATVDYGVMDLRIVNNKDRPVKYVVSVTGDKIISDIIMI